MANNGHLIYTNGDIGVSIKDVQTVLDESATDLGNLCRSENINKWARYKPVIAYGIAVRHVPNGGKPINSGFTLDTHEDSPINIILNDGLHLNYDKPYGTMLSPYRLTDFNGYDHEAVCPLLFDFDGTVAENAIVTPVLTIDNQIMGFKDNSNLYFRDIYNIERYQNYRLTAAIVTVDIINRLDTQGQLYAEPQWNTASPLRFFYSLDVISDNTVAGCEVTCYLSQIPLIEHGHTYGIVMMLTPHEYVREGTATCDTTKAIHLQLLDGGDRKVFNVISEGEDLRLDFRATIEDLGISYEGDIPLSGSPGVYYQKYYLTISTACIKNGLNLASVGFNNFDNTHLVKLTATVPDSLDLKLLDPNSPNYDSSIDYIADEESSFADRTFDLTPWEPIVSTLIHLSEWFTFTEVNNYIQIDVQKLLHSYFYLEKWSTAGGSISKDIVIDLLHKRLGSNTTASLGGITITMTGNGQSWNVTDGVITPVS